MFRSEISDMMHAFGDVKQCNPETVQLVEELTQQQMTNLIDEALKMVGMKRGKSLTLADILFLLRRDKQKLRQAVRFLKKRYYYDRIRSGIREEEEEEGEEEVVGEVEFHGTGSIGSTSTSTFDKSIKLSLEFLTENEQEDLLASDDNDMEEQQKLDEQTRTMNLTQYTDFTQSRRAAFVHKKNTGKFKEWLGLQALVGEIKTSSTVIEFLAYLAYKTVQKVIELSLIVKQEEKSYPIGGHASFATPTTVLPSDELPYGTAATFLAPPTSETSPPPPPPPGSPKNSPGTTLASPTQIITKSKSRKRSRQSKSSVAEPPPPTPPITTPPTAIQPSHVHEAIRRYTHQTNGPHLPITAHFIKPSFTSRTLCV